MRELGSCDISVGRSLFFLGLAFGQFCLRLQTVPHGEISLSLSVDSVEETGGDEEEEISGGLAGRRRSICW